MKQINFIFMIRWVSPLTKILDREIAIHIKVTQQIQENKTKYLCSVCLKANKTPDIVCKILTFWHICGISVYFSGLKIFISVEISIFVSGWAGCDEVCRWGDPALGGECVSPHS